MTSDRASIAVVEPLGSVTPQEAFEALADRGHCLYLDSARRHPELGRYSFIAADPFKVITVAPHESHGMRRLADACKQYATPTIPELPPFQGGIAGLWSYELVRSMERVPQNRFDEFQLPQLTVGIYDVVVAFDHHTQQSWLISQGFPELDPQARKRRAEQRAQQVRAWIEDDTPAPPARKATKTLTKQQLAPCFETPHATVFSNFAQQDYLHAVAKVIDYINAGDVFQVNLSQRLLTEATSDSVSLYRKLRERNPATFAGYFDLGERQIMSASPERFVNVRDRVVQSRPIKGTRRRTNTKPEADLFSGAELQASTKDLSENVMIVDLMRNDLSRVCEDDSVIVRKLCGLETYEHVQHLVSVIDGRLRASHTPVDLIEVAFPGGSITGAPKVRAMEIIAEMEPTARGAYCGSLGYLGFDGSMDLSILIRTITASHGWWQFPVGGGIVANSDPDRELEETWVKAEGMLRAILQ